MAKESHIYMCNIYLIYKNMKLATEVTSLDDLSVELGTGRRRQKAKMLIVNGLVFCSVSLIS